MKVSSESIWHSFSSLTKILLGIKYQPLSYLIVVRTQILGSPNGLPRTLRLSLQSYVLLVILIFPDMVMVLPVNMLIILLLHTLMVLVGFAKDFGVYGCQFHTKNLASSIFSKSKLITISSYRLQNSKRQEVFAFLSPRSDILMRIWIGQRAWRQAAVLGGQEACEVGRLLCRVGPTSQPTRPPLPPHTSNCTLYSPPTPRPGAIPPSNRSNMAHLCCKFLTGSLSDWVSFVLV